MGLLGGGLAAPLAVTDPLLGVAYQCANGHVVPYLPNTSCQICFSPMWTLVQPDEPKLDASDE